MNELIEMSFGGQTPVGKEFCALDSLRISSLAGRATFAWESNLERCKGGCDYNGVCGGDTTLSRITVRYDTRCYFNVRSKADISQLNLPHGNRQLKSVKTEKSKKTDMLRSNSKQSGKSIE